MRCTVNNDNFTNPLSGCIAINQCPCAYAHSRHHTCGIFQVRGGQLLFGDTLRPPTSDGDVNGV